MKSHKRKLFRRVSKEISKRSDGCESKECPFKEGVEGFEGTAQDCRCKEELTDLARQLTKEVEAIK